MAGVGGDEGAAAIVPVEVAAGLAVQMHRWREATRHGDEIAGDAPGLPADDRSDGRDRCAVRLLEKIAGARVDCCHHLGTGADQGVGCAVDVVGATSDHDAPSRHDGETFDIGAHGARQHDAGPVVAAEQQGPLDGAGGKDDPAGADMPKALRQRAGGGARFDQPFDQRDEIMVVIA